MINLSLTLTNTYDWLLYNCLFLDRCSLSLTAPVNNVSSHIYMNILNFFLCGVIITLIIPMNINFHDIPDNHLENSYRTFRLYRNVLICLALSCLCNQLVSAFACRPIDILYSIRFTSMIIVQAVGFFVCLVFAFLLGIKYVSLNNVP